MLPSVQPQSLAELYSPQPSPTLLHHLPRPLLNCFPYTSLTSPPVNILYTNSNTSAFRPIPPSASLNPSLWVCPSIRPPPPPPAVVEQQSQEESGVEKVQTEQEQCLVRTLLSHLNPRYRAQSSPSISFHSSTAAADTSSAITTVDYHNSISSAAAVTVASPPQTAFDGTNVLCQVCGDRASGFHYGTYSCEGCKGFFRRSIQQKIQYRPCSKNQQCEIIRISRNRCQYCRLKKCITVGMSKDAVRFGRVPKREKVKIMEEMQRANGKVFMDSVLNELEDDEHLVSAIISAHLDTCILNRGNLGCLLDQLGPSRPRMSSIACPLYPRPLSPQLSTQQSSHVDFPERYLYASLESVVRFAQSIPGFQILCQEDKQTLLKAGQFSVLLLRLSILFDPETRCLLLLDGSIYGRGSEQQQQHREGHFLKDSFFDFIQRFCALGLADAEIAVYSSVILLSPDQPGLRNRDLVQKMNERLKAGLRKVLNQHHPTQPTLYDHLMEKVRDLRTLNLLHSEKLNQYRTDGSRLNAHRVRSDGASVKSETPSSDGHSEFGLINNYDVSREEVTSHWSTACKASDGSSSTSPSPLLPNNNNNNVQQQQIEAAHRLLQFRLKYRSKLMMSNEQEKKEQEQIKAIVVYPAREASSFDSGKGTLSNKASSASDTDSEDGHAHRLHLRNGKIHHSLVKQHKHSPMSKVSENMPALKRALLAPTSKPVTVCLQQPQQIQHQQAENSKSTVIRRPETSADKQWNEGGSSILERHRLVASLLEKPSDLIVSSEEQQSSVLLDNLQQQQQQQQRHQSLLLLQRPIPQMPLIRPAHRSSPKRSYHLFNNDDEQPLNLSKKSSNHLRS